MVAEFDLVVGRSLAHVLDLLGSQPDARIIAGATDFIPFVRVGRWRPRMVVDITHLEEMRTIEPALPDPRFSPPHGEGQQAGGLEIGSLVTHAQLMTSPLVRQHAPVLAEAAACVAGPQVRSRGTLGGNLCTASPAADTVPALLVLDAQVRLLSAAGERRLPLAEFLVGPGKTALQPGEMLYSVHVPALPDGAGTAFGKVGKRRALVISVVNGAALLALEEGRIAQARIALGSVAPTVVRCAAAERFLAGRLPQTAETEWLEGTAARVLEAIHPIDDVRGSAAYRRAAAVGLVRRMLVEAWGRVER